MFLLLFREGFFVWLVFAGIHFVWCGFFHQDYDFLFACCNYKILKIVKEAVERDFKSPKYRGWNLF